MLTRVISAVAAILGLIFIYKFADTEGLYGVCVLVTLGSMYEYSRLTFRKSSAPLHLRVSFFVLCFGVFASTAWLSEFAGAWMAVASIIFLSMVVANVSHRQDLPGAIHLQSAGLVGFVYCGLFPGLATRLLSLDHGQSHLFGLMGIVFAGDTFAYLFGRAFGRHKVLEPVSPKKTVEGAIGGLLGSGIAGFILAHYFLPDFPVWGVVGVALVTGVFAQVGDFYESLLKRIADVKDSGSIMPGHGGILDRVDGVYFGAPIFFVLMQLLHHHR